MIISVVIPIFNERQNIARLHAELRDVLDGLEQPYELLFVDDGSTDGSRRELALLAARDPGTCVIEFRRNFGQTAALAAGIQAATGEVIVTLDGDRQNDPADIPRLLEKLDEGYDLVHGWRIDRKDPLFSRRLPSQIANRIISWVTGFPVHDLGCALKAMRREIACELELFGEMHRFIPILAHWQGARCAEIETNHRPRMAGRSKYGLSRVPRVLLDLVTVKYFVQYLVSPMKLFGTIGLVCGLTALLTGGSTVYMKVAHAADMTGNPLLLLSAFAAMASVQFLGMGMLGELGARIYYRVRDREAYSIRRTINLGDEAEPSPSILPMKRIQEYGRDAA